MPKMFKDSNRDFYSFVLTYYQNNPYIMLERFASQIADVASSVSIDWCASKQNVDLNGTKVSGKRSIGLTKPDAGRTWIIGFTNEYEGHFKGNHYKIKFPLIRFQNFRKHFPEPVIFDGCNALWEEFKRYNQGEKINRHKINMLEKSKHLERLKKFSEDEKKDQLASIEKDRHWLGYMKKRSTSCPYFKRKGIPDLHHLIELYVGSTSKGPFIGEFTAIKLTDAKTDVFRGIQRIYPETGSKVFRKGLNPSGAILKIGDLIDGEPIFILEAPADAALSYVLTEHCSVAALYADNIGVIAKVLSKRFPNSTLIFVADNDQYNGANKGVDTCERSIKNIESQTYLIIPEFENPEQKLRKKDLTDYYGSYGEVKTKALLQYV
ncbi:MAG: hypothetical protein HRT37_01360 [Alteromonadaceae bacterium]|nr:hypothetical protein [Alteromonadaceae bacterium]